MKKTIIALMTLILGSSCGSQGFTNQNNAEFAATIADPGVILLDVRTPSEFMQAHIPGAVNIDVQSSDFDSRIAGLDKMHPVAVYCRSGMRSRTAAKRLAAQGFEVYNLSGGIIGWDGTTTE